MSSSRYMIIDRKSIDGKSVVLSASESRHLMKVLRARRGEEIGLLDGLGRIYRATFVEAGPEGARLEVSRVEDVRRPPSVDIAMGLFKPARMEMAVEKCTELGVRRIIPFSCRRSVWKDEGDNRMKKHERLARKVGSACKQCGQPWFPEVVEPVDLEGLSGLASSYERVFLADKDARCLDLSAGGLSAPVLGIIGPEGGLTGEESTLLRDAGAETVSLGLLTLRSETAATCLAFALVSACMTPD